MRPRNVARAMSFGELPFALFLYGNNRNCERFSCRFQTLDQRRVARGPSVR
jgi:hypothetical protein